MDTYLKFIQMYFKIISFVAPSYAAKYAFKTFQKVRKKDVRFREQGFYDRATSFRVSNCPEDIYGYELGDENGKVIFLIHGWDSNAGSLSKIAFELSEKGYRVIAMNLPGHADAKRNSTNLFEAKESFKRFVEEINPDDGFHCISHSFGSAVVSYGLSEMDRKVDQLIFLTTPNKIMAIFDEFKNAVKLGDKAFNIFCDMASNVIGEEIRTLTISDKLKKDKFKHLTIIHDENDKVISINNSKEIIKEHPDSNLVTFKDIGHYRMLWNDDVVNMTHNLMAQA